MAWAHIRLRALEDCVPGIVQSEPVSLVWTVTEIDYLQCFLLGFPKFGNLSFYFLLAEANWSGS